MTRDAHVGRLEIAVERDGEAVVVRAEGEIDLNNADQLASGLRAVYGEDLVVLDLLGVPFMDSSGLKALLMACDELGERLALVLSPGSPIVSLLEMAGVKDRFAVHQTPAAAIAERTEAR